MKSLFTPEGFFKSGRSARIGSPQRLQEIPLGNPMEMGAKIDRPHPALLFASAYSSCRHSALINEAKRLGILGINTGVEGRVCLTGDDQGGYRMEVELPAQPPGK